MKKRLIFFSLVIIVIVAVVLLIATKISNHPDEFTVIKKMEINREQKKEDSLVEEKQPAVDKKEAQEKQPAADKKAAEVKQLAADKNDAEVKQPAADKKYVEGEVLVKFKKEITNEEIKSFLSDYNLQVLDIIKGINVFRFKTPKSMPLEEILDKLNKDSRTEYAEPNYIFKIN